MKRAFPPLVPLDPAATAAGPASARVGTVLATLVMLTACLPLNEATCDAECQLSWLDGSDVRDTSDLVSVRLPPPDSAARDIPVLIAVHGFTASTYEWEEFAVFAQADDSIRVSRVLMGGHGTDVEDFRSSTWRDWARPVREEYQALTRMGYRNISFAGSSTGCPVILEHLRAGAFDTIPPRHVFLIDPIVLPGDKILSSIRLAGWIVGNSPSSGTEAEKPHWYTNRPAEALEQLYALVNKVKNHLEDGMRLPPGTQAKVYKAKVDGAADPVGALLLYKGLRRADGGRIEAELLDSRLHVFTRLQGRRSVSAADSALQARVFGEMRGKLLGE